MQSIVFNETLTAYILSFMYDRILPSELAGMTCKVWQSAEL